MLSLSKKSLLALLPFYLASQVSAGASGTGTTTRYWDCCKPSCAWPGKTTLEAGSDPVGTCDITGNPITDYNAASGCNGGTAFMPAEQSPWAVDDNLAYGFAAVNIAGGDEASWCCACYELTFTSGAVAGKKMIVQATNTGGDLGSNQFDIAMPGGGVGIFNGCTTQWGAPSSGWGQQYGGISSRSDCDAFPDALKPGCYWRFDFFENADNPSVSFEQVTCPAALTAKTGCVRAGEVPTGSSFVSSSFSAASSSVSAASSTPSVVESTSVVPVASSAESTAPTAATISSPVETPSSAETSSAASSVAPVDSSTIPEPTTTLSSTTTTYTTVYVPKTTTSVSHTVAASESAFSSSASPVTKPASSSLAVTTVSAALPASSASVVLEPTTEEEIVYTTIFECPAETSLTFEPVTTVTVYQSC